MIQNEDEQQILFMRDSLTFQELVYTPLRRKSLETPLQGLWVPIWIRLGWYPELKMIR